MKYKWAALVVFVLVVLFVISQLKSNEIIISASYQKLACEKCYHMTVEKSLDPGLLGITIIPVSKVVNIEKMIDGIALNNEHVCLRGRLYKFNLNLFKIDPDGKKFEVLSQEMVGACASILVYKNKGIKGTLPFNELVAKVIKGSVPFSYSQLNEYTVPGIRAVVSRRLQNESASLTELIYFRQYFLFLNPAWDIYEALSQSLIFNSNSSVIKSIIFECQRRQTILQLYFHRIR